jgi:hypothetical protein
VFWVAQAAGELPERLPFALDQLFDERTHCGIAGDRVQIAALSPVHP